MGVVTAIKNHGRELKIAEVALELEAIAGTVHGRSLHRETETAATVCRFREHDRRRKRTRAASEQLPARGYGERGRAPGRGCRAGVDRTLTRRRDAPP